MGKENPLSPCEAVHIPESAFGHLMWPIINKLFIWRETCFFDGSELKKQAAVPYCVSKELSLWNFLSAHEKGRQFAICWDPTPAPCFMWGSLFAHRPALSAWAARQKLLPPSWPHIIPPQLLLLACEHLIRIEEPCLQPESGVHCETVADADSGAVREAGGRSKRQHVPVSPCSPPLLIMLKVSCALFPGLSRSWGNSVNRPSHTPLGRLWVTPLLKFP